MPSDEFSTSRLIEFDNVTIVRAGRVALDSIDFRITPNENVAVLGPNGCGKSTLVKTVAGDLRPFAGRGRVSVGGLARWNIFELRRILGIVTNELQTACAKEVTALDLVISGFFGSYGELRPYEVNNMQRTQAHEVLQFVDAGHLAGRRTCELSSGEGRRVLIARALVNSPQALLLDEPTTSLDLPAATRLVQSLRKIASAGTDVLLVTHHIEEIFPEIQRVILLKNGRIHLDGPTASVMTSENLSDIFDVPIRLEHRCGVYRADIEVGS